MGDGVSNRMARRLHAELLGHGGGGLLPHPDDSLICYGLGPDELEEIIGSLWNELGLPEPDPKDPQIVPPCETVLDLARFLEREKAASEGRPADMQKPPEIRRLAGDPKSGRS